MIQSLRFRGGIISDKSESTHFRHCNTVPTEQAENNLKAHFRQDILSTESAQFRHTPNLPTEPTCKLINAQHVQTSARLQMYKQRDNLSKGNLVNSPAALIQPPRIVGNSGVLHSQKTKNKKGGWIN